MTEHSKWIWRAGADECRFAQLRREYVFGEKIVRAVIYATGDTFFRLSVNGTHIGRGPHCPGGDYDGSCKFSSDTGRAYYRNVIPKTYVSTYEIAPDSPRIAFFAEVRFGKIVFTDVSAGKGGFRLEAELFFADGTKTIVGTDRTWEARADRRRQDAKCADDTAAEEAFRPAAEVEDVWHLFPTQIQNLTEEKIAPITADTVSVSPGAECDFSVEFDRVYAGYPCFEIDAQGVAEITVSTYEVPGRVLFSDRITVVGVRRYESELMCGCGGYTLHIRNRGDHMLTLSGIGVNHIHYPIAAEGSFTCSEPLLCDVYEAGKQALKNCMQSIHLDSPTHQENLGCTGDYYIESLMGYYAFGETRLVRFDLLRTADLLREGHGRMFHTTYSLIWLQMLWDYYLYSGDREIFAAVEDAIGLLLARFEKNETENGLLDHMPDYMFVDWLEIDGFSMHHPPKCLGQTVLNAFYYKAQCVAAEIYALLGEQAQSKRLLDKTIRMKKSFCDTFFDGTAGLFFDGLTDKEEEALLGKWQPQNGDRRYYSLHSNALAALYGLCPDGRQAEVLERALSDKSLIRPQPYFMHFVLEAVDKAGLFDRYGMDILRQWENAVDRSKLALKEGWIRVNDYGFDLSHAWGGTPTYQLPARLLGLRMLEPGWKKIAVRPSLFGLARAAFTIPTPYGMISCRMEEGKAPEVNVPQEIAVVWDDPA